MSNETIETLNELDVVEVTKLDANQPLSETPGYARAPRIGDRGTIVSDYGTPTGPVAVECVDAGGQTVWLADIPRACLKRVQSTPA